MLEEQVKVVVVVVILAMLADQVLSVGVGVEADVGKEVEVEVVVTELLVVEEKDSTMAQMDQVPVAETEALVSEVEVVVAPTVHQH